MTRRSPSAPRQVEITQRLSKLIDQSPYLFVTSDEVATGTKVVDGDWLNRIQTFLNDHESGVSSDEDEREYATALITRRFKRYLGRRLVTKLTRCLEPVKQYPPGSREERLAKVKRAIKKVEP